MYDSGNPKLMLRYNLEGWGGEGSGEGGSGWRGHIMPVADSC